MLRMRTLLLMRHAKSAWDDPALGDHERVLNARGRRDAPRMGELLLREGLVPDLVLCSGAARTRETAALLFEAFGVVPEVVYDDALYLASPVTLLDVVAAAPAADTLLVLAHNPGIAEWASALAGRELAYPTATVAAFECAIDAWSGLPGVSRSAVSLRGSWRPKEL